MSGGFHTKNAFWHSHGFKVPFNSKDLKNIELEQSWVAVGNNLALNSYNGKWFVYGNNTNIKLDWCRSSKLPFKNFNKYHPLIKSYMSSTFVLNFNYWIQWQENLNQKIKLKIQKYAYISDYTVDKNTYRTTKLAECNRVWDTYKIKFT